MARDLHLLTWLYRPFRYILPVFLFALISLTSKAQCPPTVIATPATASVCMGDSVQMVCSPATGTTWQWYKDGILIPAATSSTCYAFGDGNYTVTTGICPFPSNTIHVVMKPLPAISVTSSAVTLCSGEQVTLNVNTTANWVWMSPPGLFGSNTTPITQTLTVTTIFQVVGVDLLTNCSNTFTLPIPVVPPLLPGAIMADAQVCMGGTPPLITGTTATGGSGVYTYQWQISTTDGISGFTDIPGATGLNYQPGPTTMDTWYRRTVISVPCPDQYTSVVMVQVNPTPSVTSNATKRICSGNSVAYTPTANIAGSTFNWTASVTSGSVSGVTAAGNGPINDILSLPAGSSATGTVTYVITPIGPAPTLCAGTPFNFVVTIYPIPLVTNAVLSQDICASTTTTPVILQSNVPSATFTWSAVATAGLSGYQVSGSGNIPAMQIFSTLLVAGTVTYTITPHGPAPASCNGPSVDYVINVNPSPSITNASMQQSICSGGTTTLVVLTSNMPSPNFTWTATAVPVSLTGFLTNGTNTIPAQTINNPSNVQGVVTYVVVPSGSINGCVGIPKNYIVLVNPIPVVTATPASEEICSSNTTNIALTSNVVNTTFSWTASAPGSLVGFSNGSGNTIAQTITNTSNAPHNVTYVITPTANGCAGSPITVIVTVNPAINLTVVPAAPFTCSGVPMTVTLVANAAGVSFSWTASAVGNVTGYSNGTGATITQTLINNDNVTRFVVYSVMLSLNGCNAGPFNFTATVYPTPSITNNPLGSTQCSGATFNLALGSTVAGSTYSWTANGTPGITGFANGNGGTINQTLANSTTATGSVVYSITPTANGCPGSPVDYTVTVNPVPNVILSLANQSICSGSTTTRVNFSSTVSGTNYNWVATPSGAGISGYTASGSVSIPPQIINSTLTTPGTVTYTVTPSISGCNGPTGTHVITVNPLPLVTNAPMSQEICTGTPTSNVNLNSNVAGTTFTWIATPSSAAITGYQPSGNNTIPTQTIFNSSNVPGTVTYQIIPTSNFGPACQGTSVNYVTTINPTPTVTSNLSDAVCSGQVFTYTITSNLAGASYLWSRAAVAGISNPPTAGSASTISEILTNLTGSDIVVTYIITPYGQAPTNCPGSSVNLSVTVRALPQVNAGSDLTIPYGTSTTISGTTSGGTGALTYVWTPNAYIASGATTLLPLTINLNATRTFTLSVNDAAGCSASDNMTIFITGSALSVLPTATPTDICLGQNSVLNANATGGSGTYTYSWTSVPAGFTSTSSTPTVSPFVNTVYTVTVNDGFNMATSSVAVTVNPLPVQYGLTGGGSYCNGGTGVSVGITGSQAGVTYQLYNNSNPVGTPILGTGGALSFGNQTLAGTYTVIATRVSTGCSMDMGSSVSVSINPLPIADAGADQIIPYGTSTTLNGSVSGGFGMMNYSWTPVAFIGVGANSPSPLTSNLYSNTTFTLDVTDANGCQGTDQVSVSLSGSAINVVASSVPGQICADTSQAQLQANVSGGAGSYSFSWTCSPAGSPIWTSTQQNPFVSPDVTTTYTVIVNDGFNTAVASATIVVNPLPLVYGVTGGGSYCFGYAGVPIGLSGSELNVDYQLFRGGVADGPPVTGTGNPISFGNRSAAFTYTVLATNNTTGCINLMNGNATVVIIAPPTAYMITGGGSYPFGGPGRNVGLSYGDLGISYQLYCNNIPVGLPVTGTETAIDFGLQIQAGTYTVTATDMVTGCIANMNGSVAITILPLPVIFGVTGGGAICAGDPGLTIGLSGSEAGVDYQLLHNGFPYGSLVAGTNLSLSWGPYTFSGLFEVRAINSVSGATQMMNDSAVIIVNPLPTIFTLNPTGSQCPGTILRLNGSEAGFNYYLLFNGITIDSIVGTGVVGFLDYGPQTMNGAYTIKAVNPLTGCEAMMNGSMYINVSPLVFNVIPAGILCPGQLISLTGSEVGVNYQLRWNGTFDLGAPVAGTGSAIILGTAGLPGIYSAIAINATTNCVSYMNNSATLYPDPTAFSIVPDGTACEGDIVSLNGSQVGVDYVLILDNAIHLDTISGTGFPLSFGPQLTEGNYTILAIDQTSYCLFPMSGTAILNDSPIKYTLQPAGLQCIGTIINLSGSQPGVSYQLMLNGLFNVGIPVSGAGSVISFGPQSLSGTYTVRAVNDITGCNTLMSDSTVLGPLPAVFMITPIGNFCEGTTVILNGSEINFNYILVLNGSINLDTIPGTGSSIDFGPQTTTGSYSVVAYNSASFCSGLMSGNTVIEAVPNTYNMTPAGIICSGAAIGLDNSEAGVSYQLRWNGTTNVGSPVAGTGFAISFGAQTITGLYTVIAIGSNSCVATMNGSVFIDPLPVVYTVAPSGTNCAGTPIGLNGSDINVNYVLILNGAIHIDTIAGTGAAISFGAQVTAGTYTVLAYNSLTNCQMTMNGASVIDVAPIAYTMTPAGIDCSGATLGLANSEIGVDYQLRWNGTTNVGSPVTGAGAAISFGAQVLTGTYTVIATGSNSCVANMTGNVVIGPLPIDFTITPSGSNCAGTPIGINGSEVNVNYILILNGAIHIDTITGTGAAISFGSQVTAGNYTVLAYNSFTNCQIAINGSSMIEVAPLAYAMTPAGIACSGSVIGLVNSEIGVNYQLRWNGTINIGSPVAGTGAAISFGAQTLTGIYSVIATNANGCYNTMSSDVQIEPIPVAFNLIPSGAQCQGTSLGLDGSEVNVNYTLVLNGIILVDTIPGTGGTISFGPQLTSGNYTVIAFNATTNCQSLMNGTTAVSNVAPAIYSMTPAGIICTGAMIGLDNSEIGAIYQLRWNGTINMGSPVVGTGSAISFGVQNLSGTYTAIAINSNGCNSQMSGNVIVNPNPTAFNIIPVTVMCPGGSIGIDGSEPGVNYTLVLNGSINIDTIAGTGAPLTFGPQITSGIYTIFAYNSTTLCQTIMNGNSVINPAPIAFNLTPAGIICEGATLGLDNSEIGVTYQLRLNGIINIGTPVTGIGTAISFGNQTLTGIYTAIATHTNGCSLTMNGAINLNPNPTAYTITPSGIQCQGTSIGIDGSEIGVNYVLILNGSIHIDTISGSGSGITFGAQATSGIYTVLAYYTATSCLQIMNGTTTINSAPSIFNMIPAGVICAGATLGIDGSNVGVTYQLRRNGTINVGSPVAGTGLPISFGVQTVPGTYTVEAAGSNGCPATMNGTVVINPTPLVYTQFPSGSHCPGAVIILNGSEIGVNYILYRDGIFSVDTLAGTGSALNFGAPLIGGTYTIKAFLASALCPSTMNGNTIILVSPTAFNVTPAGTICSGSTIGLDDSEAGLTYQLRRDGITNVGAPVAGTGSAISFGILNIPGTYTVIATSTINGCTTTMLGNAALLPVPLVYTITLQGMQCAGTSIILNGSQPGTDYVLVIDNIFDIDTLAGTGTVINFGPQFVTGTYTVEAIGGATTCQSVMTGSTQIMALPATFNLTPAGLSCITSTLGLDGSETGVDYTLYKNSISTGITIPGTGSALSFGMQMFGDFTVEAVDQISGCSIFMPGTLTIGSPAQVNAGSDVLVCSTQTVQLNATVSFSSSTSWTTAGNGTFDNANILNAVYTPGATDIAAGSVNLLLTVQGTGSCAASQVTDTLLVTFDLPATANAGSDIDVCLTSDYTVIGASATNYLSLNWTSSGTGSLVNGNTLTPTYSPSAADLTSGSVTLTLIVTGNSPCSNTASDAVIMTFHPMVAANAGPDNSICAGNDFTFTAASASNNQSVSWSTAGTGTFAAANTLTATYSPSAADLTAGSTLLILTAQSNAPCAVSVSDTMVLAYILAPVSNAGADVSICENTSLNIIDASTTNSTSLLWSTSGTGIFNNNAIINPIYIPSVADIASGSVTLTLTVNGDAACAAVTDQKIVTFILNPLVNAGPDATICTTPFVLSGAASANCASVLWTVQNGSGTLINANTLNPTYTASASDIANGFAILLLTGTPVNPCVNVVSDFVTLTIDQIPVVNAGADSATCNNSNFTVIDATASHYSALSWTSTGTGTLINASTLNPTYTPSAGDLAIGSVTLTLTASNAGCGIFSDSKIISFINQTTVNAGPDVSVCEGSSLTIGGASATAFSSIFWTTSGSGSFANGNTVSPTYTPSVSDIANGSVTLTMNAISTAPCSNVLSDQTILTIRTRPIVWAGDDKLICSSDVYSNTDAFTMNCTTITWSTSGTGTFSDPNILVNTYTPSVADFASGSVMLTLTTTNNAPCADMSDQKEISFMQTPIADAGPVAIICTSCSFETTAASTQNSSAIQWSSSGSGTFNNISNINTTYTPGASDIAQGSVILSLTAFSNPPCNQVSDTTTIFFSNNPGVDFTWSAACEAQPVAFSVDPAATNIGTVATWFWNFGDGTTSVLMNPGHLFAAIGEYYVTLTAIDTTGIARVITHKVTISQLPVSFFSYSQPNCSNEPVVLTDLSHTLYGYIAEWIWNYGDGSDNDTIQFPDEPNVAHQFTAPGTFNVILSITNSFGCKASVTIPVDVIEAPVANFQYTNDCSGLETSFVDASYANGPGNTVQYWWNFGDPATGVDNYSDLKDATHIFSAPGIYQVMHVVRNFNNCTDTIIKPVTILTPVIVDFVYDHTCVDGVANFAPDATVMNITDITSWFWDFGDGVTNNQQNTSHVYAGPGSYLVTLKVTDLVGCTASKTRTVVVNPLPVAMFNVAQLPCEDAPVHFDDVSTTYSGYIVKWNWDFGDGNTQQINFPANADADHIYLAAGTYTVKLTIYSSDSCKAERQQTIVISPAPTANFDFENACQGTAVQFTDLTQIGGSGTINGWAWNFGDDATGANNISNLQNPAHTYNTTGTYQVTLTVSTADGCSSTIVKTVIITVAPFVDFAYDNHCVATEIQFTPAAGVVIANVATWNWSFGDGISSALPNPQHTYNTPGNYTVTLTITNTTGCQNTISHAIQVLPAPVANFSTSAPACSQHQVTFSNHSSAPVGYIISWEYDFGDGNSVVINYPANPNVTHTYTTYGTFNAILTVVTNDNCSATTSRSIQILPSPMANFDYDAACSGLPVQFTDLSQGNLISWAWNFGDSGSGLNNTSTLQNPVHTFQQAGNYQITLLVLNANGCNDTVNQTISISPKPVVDFSFNNGCAADTVHFISSTFVNVAATASWVWQFGDNSTSTDVDPYHIYTTPGTYIVSLTITNLNGCTNVKTRQVQVTTAPNAMFTANTSSCSGTAVLFTDISSTPNGTIDSWTWNFGDGTITTVYAPANPDISHTYTASGIYDVTLTIQTTTGCEAHYTTAITVNDASATAFSYAGSCDEQPTAFTDLSQSAGGSMIIGWSWNFGDPVSGINNTSGLQNPQHLFSSPGTYTVTLTTENTLGCSSSLTQTITITPAPAVDFILTPSCLGTAVTFSADASVTNIAQVASYLWDFGDGSATSGQAAPEHLYTQAGIYTVVLTITNLTGCLNSVSHTITVHALPVAQFTNTGNCAANLVQFTDLSFNPDGEDIVAWTWDFGVSTTTTDTSSQQNPSYVYTAAGSYNVTLTITSESGCTNVKVMPVVVIPAPQAQYSYTAEPCHNGSVLFQDESISSQSVITGWYWEFAPGVYSTLQNPVHVFGNTDTCFNVKLIVTTANGCTDTLIKEVCIPTGLDVTFDYTQTCFGETTWFTPTLVEPAGGSISYYNWNFGDPITGIDNESKVENPQHKFSKTGTFVVSLQATDANNCSTTRYVTIIVSPLPIASFITTGGKCDTIVSFKDLTTVAPIARWIWNFGDGKSDTIDAPENPNVNHSYPYPGVFDVTLTTQSVAGCSDSITKTIRRTPCISAEFSVSDTIVCQKRRMRFAENSQCQAPIASWQWFFGDNTSVTYTSPQSFIEHTYAVAGNYTVKMVVATQMVGGLVTDTVSNQVVVKPAAKAAYKWQNVCIGNTTEFENQTQNNNTVIKNYNWNFGVAGSSADTSSLKNPAYDFDIYGQYDVKLVVTNTLGCTDTIVNKVTIFETPAADFDWNNSCEGKPVYFADNSDSTSSAVVKWNWIFSEAGEVLGASTKVNCSYNFGQAGIYDAALKITDRNGCSDTIRKQVAINSSPAAAFNIVENYEDKQGQVSLNNGTINGTNYEWDFGNGTTSSATNPVVTFDKEGKYEIRLITWNGQNCADTLSITYELMFKGLFVPNAFNPGNMDPEVAVFRPKGTNLKTYYAEVFDRWGNSLWSSSKLDGKGSPTESWDGKLHGEVLKQDVYLWKISAQFLDGEYWDGHNIGNNENMPQTKAGTVTLIR